MILETAFMCMALNIYHEAKNQPFEGQIAVAQVVLNRVKDKRYPNNICEVVEQGPVYESWKTRNDDTQDAVYWPVKNRCQFSWYCDGKKDEPNYNSKSWSKALNYAVIVLGGDITLDVTSGATHYHATYVEPNWAGSLQLIGTIGKHVFYRWN